MKSESSGPTPHPASVPEGDDVFTLRSTVWESSLGGVLSLRLSHSSWRAPLQTDATRTCELLVGLRDVTVLGVDEKLRLPDEVCVDLQHPSIHRPIAIPEGSGAPFDAVTSKWGMPP